MNAYAPQAPELMAMPWPTGHASVAGHGDAWMDAAACAAGPGGLCMVRAFAGRPGAPLGTASSGPESHLVTAWHMSGTR